MNTSLARLLLCAAPLATLWPITSAISAATPQAEAPTPTEAEALEMGRAYVAGISGGELDQLDLLFLPGDASSVFENASDEGSWPHYKEHHLAPEQSSLTNFKFTTDEEHVEALGSGFLVTQLGGFTFEAGGQTRSYRAALSFALVATPDGLRISHLHWSSKPA